MTWLREAVSNPAGRVSSSRITALVAGLTLAICTLVLTPLAFLEPQLVAPLTLFGTALAGMAGANYVTNKLTAKKESTHD